MGVRDPLGPAGHAVAEEADRAAEERRELVLAVDAQRAELGVEELGGLGGVAVEAEAAPRLEADEGVASEVLAAFDALEEESLGVVGREGGERGQRRERVGGELAHDRDDVVLLSQLVEVHRQASRKIALCLIAWAASKSFAAPLYAARMVVTFGSVTFAPGGRVSMTRSPSKSLSWSSGSAPSRGVRL